MKLLTSFLFLILTGTIHAQLEKTEIQYLIFEGAGIRGVSYVGVLNELEAHTALDQMEGVGGTSAGAITAMLIAAGYTSTELEEVLFDLDLQKFNDGQYFFVGGISRMKNQYGWYKTDELENTLKSYLSRKQINPDISLMDFKQATGMELRVCATDLIHQQGVVISADSYPNMRVVDAVLASLCIPYYFHPIAVDNEGKRVDPRSDCLDALYVDGGVLMNFPLHMFEDQPDGKNYTLGVRIDTEDQHEMDEENPSTLAPQSIESLEEFTQAFYVLILENLNRRDLSEADWKRTIRVNCGNVGPKIKSLDETQKKELIEAGKDAVRCYFDEETK